MAKDSWVIRVDEEVSHLSKITEAETKDWQLHSIYKLPAWVTHLNRDAYKPLTISFGPYHYGEQNLLPMEAHKHRALLRFLNRSGKSLGFYVKSLMKVVEDLKGAYESLDPKWKEDSDTFLQIMMTDGCFILEFLRVFWLNSTANSTDEEIAANDYDDCDPIFSTNGMANMMLHIHRDALILENQLPMLLLTKLISADGLVQEDDESYIYQLVLNFWGLKHKIGREKVGTCKHILDVVRQGSLWSGANGNDANGNDAEEENDEGGKENVGTCKHILDVMRKCSLWSGANGNDAEKDEGTIPSATKLHEAGIKIMTNESGSFNDITFQDNILRLPHLYVSDTTGSILLNQIAFERFHGKAGNDMTSYVLFMDDLIRDDRDVKLLHRSNIISYPYGSNHLAAAEFFRSLYKNIPMFRESDNLSALRKKADRYCSNGLIRYCKRPLNRWRIILVHKHFRNPWTAIALIAVVLVFGLTIVQTIYTIIQTLYTVRQYKQCLPPNH